MAGGRQLKSRQGKLKYYSEQEIPVKVRYSGAVSLNGEKPTEKERVEKGIVKHIQNGKRPGFYLHGERGSFKIPIHHALIQDGKLPLININLEGVLNPCAYFQPEVNMLKWQV